MAFVLEPGFTMLYDVVKEAMGGEILNFKPLIDLESTLDSLDPQTIKRMAKVNTSLGLSVKQIENLKTQMVAATQLVSKLSKLQTWNCITRCQYAGELDTLNRSLKALKRKLKHEGEVIVQENLLLLVQNKMMQLEPSVVKEIFNLARQNAEILAELAQRVPEEAAHTVLMARQKMEQLLAFERQSGTLEVQPGSIEVTGTSFAISNTGVVVDVEQESTVCGVAQVNSNYRSWVLQMRKYVKDKKTRVFKPLSVDLESTLQSIRALIEQIEKYTEVLGPEHEEVQNFKQQMKNGEKLVKNCSEIRGWKCYKKYKYANQLRHWNESLSTLLNRLSMQVIMDSMETVRNRWIEVDQSVHAVPKPPPFVCGLGVQLKELKMALLKDGVSMLVLSAPGGFGKTTLATMFCQDQEVKGKFENIIFVTFSKKPSLALIVRQLCQRMGIRTPTFPNEVIAVRWLKQFLNEERHPLLLVLDDVWSGSESILEEFDKFKLPNTKILVTSRSKFPQFGSPYYLNPLNDKDAMTLFHYSASLEDKSSHVPEDLVKQIVNRCKGFPLAITIAGRSLCGQPIEIWRKRVAEWSEGSSILDSETQLRLCLQSSLDAVDEKMATAKDCFLDLGSFPEDRKIPVAALIDMWAELYGLDDVGIGSIGIINELSNYSLANLLITRTRKEEADGYYSEHFVTQHDMLRDLAIHQTRRNSFEQEKRLIIDIHDDQLPDWWTKQREKPKKTRLLSISSIGGLFSEKWHNMRLPKAEVLVLNFQTNKFTLPKFVKKMDKLKALIVTNYDSLPAEISEFELLGSLSTLKRIRLERISIPSISKSSIRLKSLQKISLFMCSIGQAFSNSSIQILEALQNLVEMNIDYCDDLVALPDKLCDLIHLKKLSITNCHKLAALPEEIGKLLNLEILRLMSCTDLERLPGSMKNLIKLNFLDIRNCFSIKELPEHIGQMSGLRKINIRQCSRLQELPLSVLDLEQLEVICDEDNQCLFLSVFESIRIKVVKEEFNLNCLEH